MKQYWAQRILELSNYLLMKVLCQEPQESETELLNHEDLSRKTTIEKYGQTSIIQWRHLYHIRRNGKNMITFDTNSIARLITTSLSREIKAERVSSWR